MDPTTLYMIVTLASGTMRTDSIVFPTPEACQEYLASRPIGYGLLWCTPDRAHWVRTPPSAP